jgi:hypothetical protein
MAAALGMAVVMSDACVIADPPTDLPTLPPMRPTIRRASVVPPTSAVLGRWPAKFIVPVEVSDPRVDIAWATFVDYNPFNGQGYISDGVSRRAPSANGNIRTLELPIPMPSLDRCHVVEIVVALRLNTFNGQTAHTPEEPPGGDIVSWFFNPSGDLAGCPVLDAGLEPVPETDAGAEAGADAEADAAVEGGGVDN